MGLSRNLGLFSNLFSKRAVAERPRIVASAGLSEVWTWCHSSTVVQSKTSATRLVTKTGCVLIAFNCWSTVVLSVHMKTHSIRIVRALTIFVVSELLTNSLAVRVLGSLTASLVLHKLPKHECKLFGGQIRCAASFPEGNRQSRRYLGSCHRTCVVHWSDGVLVASRYGQLAQPWQFLTSFKELVHNNCRQAVVPLLTTKLSDVLRKQTCFCCVRCSESE